jgi:hypothetical protein
MKIFPCLSSVAHEKGVEKSMNLRKVSVVLLALLLAAMAMVPMVSATEQQTAQKLAEPGQPATEAKTSAYLHNEIIVELSASTAINVSQKAELIKELQEIWSGKSLLSDSRKNEILAQVSDILLTTKTATITPQWVGCTNTGCASPHNDMARVAGEKMGIASAYSTILYNNAGVPDSWGSANHYAISGAPAQVASWANQARPLIRSGSNPSLGYTYLAYSMHFMSDMSVPFHYSPLFGAKHISYEKYVDNNWNAGSIKYVDSINGNNYYYYITDPSTSASNLITYASGYEAYIVSAMDTSTWGTDATLISDTRDCLIQGERYDMGLVNYVTRA